MHVSLAWRIPIVHVLDPDWRANSCYSSNPEQNSELSQQVNELQDQLQAERANTQERINLERAEKEQFGERLKEERAEREILLEEERTSRL